MSPEGAVTESAEFIGGAAEAAADPEHDEPLQQSASFERDFPGVAAAQEAGFDAALKDRSCDAGGRGRLEVTGELARTGAGSQEHEVEQMRVWECEIEIELDEFVEAFPDGLRHRCGVEQGSKFGKALVGDGVEEAFAVREVAVKGHRGDADGFGDFTHGDGVGAVAVENAARLAEDAFGSWKRLLHVYAVYRVSIQRIRKIRQA